ncbi:GreA/GreB family elongation factor [Candidatus Roizmanbacteria bacterium]|nr:GreA/GreB family elongation factor [Candidatus Roizmanbacteria bacterium]
MRKIQLTKQGYEDLVQEEKKMQADRILAVKELQRAREMGDLSENAAYRVARSRLSGIDNRLRRVKGILKRAVVIQAPLNGFADMGSRVVIHDGDEEREIVLVDGYESDFMKGKISVYSPIGKALRGKREGVKVTVITPTGQVTYTISSLT